MRTLLIFILVTVPVAAQTSSVQLLNLTRVGNTDFQVGDKYEIVITSWANEPVSVRTTRNAVTDWSFVLGWTDQSGHWGTEGQFEKGDFGAWSQGWTVGGKRAIQPLEFFVTGACLPGRAGVMNQSGFSVGLTCETAKGEQTFLTPSLGDSFRTPDGRVVPGWANHSGTPEQRMGMLIEGQGGRPDQAGDDAAALITKVIGENVLDSRETGNVLQIIRTAFQNVDRSATAASNPIATLALLKRLANDTVAATLKREIAATRALLQPL